MDRNTTDMSSTEILAMEYYDAPTLLFHWLTVLFVVVLFGTSLL